MEKTKFWGFQGGRWVTMDCVKSGTGSSLRRKLKMLTQNIMFDVVSRREHIVQSKKRYVHIVNRLKEDEFDIVCLNEVTNSFLSLLSKEVWLREKYFLSCISFPEGKFGQLIVSKFPFSGLFEYTYSCLKPLTSCIIGVIDDELCLCSVHFLSREENYKIREKQLIEIYEVLKGNEFQHIRQSIVCGDFNFHDEEESGIIQEGFVDLWKENVDMKEHPGYTFDYMKNKMITKIWKTEDRQMRLDRIILKNGEGFEEYFVPSSFKLYLDEEIGDHLFPSDHFGIRYTLTLSKKE